MAKKSMIEREKKRALILERFRAKRLELKKTMLSKDVSDEERWSAQLKIRICLVTQALLGSSGDAGLLEGLMEYTENLDYAVTNSGKQQCEETFLG